MESWEEVGSLGVARCLLSLFLISQVRDTLDPSSVSSKAGELFLRLCSISLN